MKKIFLFLLLSVFVSSILFSQNKKPVPLKKNATSTKKEIDVLADKYKGKETITVYTSHGEMVGSIYIENNPDDKPQSVSISFSTDNIEIAKEFILKVVNQKKKQGYYSNDANTNFLDPFFMDSQISQGFIYTYTKGKMYFIVECKQEYGAFFNEGSYSNTYSVRIETGDNSRKGGKKAENFEF
jgi:hypothetical protein